VQQLSEVGVDAIKLIYDDMSVYVERPMPMMKPEILAAIIEVAHEHGLKAFVHALLLENAKVALRAGADGVVHGIVDAPVDDEFLDLMKENEAVYISTQTLFEATDLEALTRRLVELDAAGRVAQSIYDQLLDPAAIERFERVWPNLVFARAQRPITRSNLKVVFEAGIPVVIGTDTGIPGVVLGIATHMELLLHVEAGINPAAVLRAATLNAARMLGRDHDLGTVEEGKLADLLILDADPLEDIRNTLRIHGVVKGGIFYDPAESRR